MCVFSQSANEFVQLAQTTEKSWKRALQHEHNVRVQLEENLETLAKQMHGLEREAKRASTTQEMEESRELTLTGSTAFVPSGPVYPRQTQISTTTSVSPVNGSNLPDGNHEFSPPQDQLQATAEPRAVKLDNEDDDDDEDKFFDALEATEVHVQLPVSSEQRGHKRTESAVSVNEASLAPTELATVPLENLPTMNPDRTMTVSSVVFHCLIIALFTCIYLKPPVAPTANFLSVTGPTIANRRVSIPPRPNARINLWSIMKNCIGKELTKIAMPVSITSIVKCSTCTVYVYFIATFKCDYFA